MKYKLTKHHALRLRDMGVAAQYHALPTDTRVQLKMPSEVVAALDHLFPHLDRSQIVTQLALDAILQKLRFSDHSELALLAKDEQSRLDTLWDYLEEREHHV